MPPLEPLPESRRLVEHELGPGHRCLRCGADYSWFSGLPVGTVVLGLRDEDDGPCYTLPMFLGRRRSERCDPTDPWPPRILMITANDPDGALVVLGYRRVPE